jgi:hypothetical protein
VHGEHEQHLVHPTIKTVLKLVVDGHGGGHGHGGIGGATTGSSMGSRPGSILGKKKTAKHVTIRCHARCPASILSPSLSLTRIEPSRARSKSISTGGLKTVLKMRPAR